MSLLHKLFAKRRMTSTSEVAVNSWIWAVRQPFAFRMQRKRSRRMVLAMPPSPEINHADSFAPVVFQRKAEVLLEICDKLLIGP